MAEILEQGGFEVERGAYGVETAARRYFGKGVHDLNLAARYADHLVAVRGGRLHAAGHPSEVLTEQCVEEVFAMRNQVVADPVSGRPMVLPIGRHHAAAPTTPAGRVDAVGLSR